jgi:hypothetical protein
MVTSAFTTVALAGNHGSSITFGLANTLDEHRKRRKYAPLPIVPILFEAHGRVGDDTPELPQQAVQNTPQTRASPHVPPSHTTTIYHPPTPQRQSHRSTTRQPLPPTQSPRSCRRDCVSNYDNNNNDNNTDNNDNNNRDNEKDNMDQGGK